MISISPSSTFLTYVAILLSPACGVYISQLIRYARACSPYDQVWFQAIYWQTSWCHRGFYGLVYRQLSAKSLQRLSLPIQPSFRAVALWCVSYQSLSLSCHTNLDYGSNHLPELELGLTAGVTWSTGNAYSSSAPDPISNIPGIQRSVFAHSQIYISYRTYEIDYCSVRYLCYFIARRSFHCTISSNGGAGKGEINIFETRLRTPRKQLRVCGNKI
jgi:hypothetical protein